MIPPAFTRAAKISPLLVRVARAARRSFKYRSLNICPIKIIRVPRSAMPLFRFNVLILSASFRGLYAVHPIRKFRPLVSPFLAAWIQSSALTPPYNYESRGLTCSGIEQQNSGLGLRSRELADRAWPDKRERRNETKCARPGRCQKYVFQSK